MNRMSLILGIVLSLIIFTKPVFAEPCDGDLNCDGVVDGTDLAEFATTYGASACGTCADVISELEQLKDRIEYLELYHPDRFTDMGDGTIRDNNTGLYWLKFASCTLGLHQNLLWDEAMNIVEGLSYLDCGLSDGSYPGDWRLPTNDEFGELISIEWASVGPALSDRRGGRQWREGDAFTEVKEMPYWTSSGSHDMKIVRNMDDGNYFSQHINDREGALIWPVRGELPDRQ